MERNKLDENKNWCPPGLGIRPSPVSGLLPEGKLDFLIMLLRGGCLNHEHDPPNDRYRPSRASGMFLERSGAVKMMSCGL